ncbi:MAG: 16S rRNA (adenine(1518)-N(6)/adenine(1519)-N(6))-dimethyltransferase RsmA [Candidatus Kapaibacterium sp.]
MNLTANKSLGQNFLVDEKARMRIADAAGIAEGDVVIEIGPGTGLLTKELLKYPLKKLIAFEVDERAVALLGEEIHDERFEVRGEDFLKVDINALKSEAGSELKVIGNIPYYITSPILFKLIDDREHVTFALLLMQLEVAERLTASPSTKAYGIPTVLANFFGEVKMLFKVKAGCFRPVPNVDSALVRIDFHRDYFSREGLEAPPGFDPKNFQSFVRTMFGMRRKMLRNNLKSFLDADMLAKVAEHPDIIPFLTRRAEELDVAHFLSFYRKIEASR